MMRDSARKMQVSTNLPLQAAILLPAMPEIEIKTEGGESDPLGQKVGVLAAVLAVCLAVVSIQSHRAHTTAVVERSEANDQWSLYQSNRIKFHSLELGVDLMNVLGRDKPEAEQTISRYETQQKKYEKEGIYILEYSAWASTIQNLSDSPDVVIEMEIRVRFLDGFKAIPAR
jgi:hypothetical protein